jgi:hypothetical protein
LFCEAELVCSRMLLDPTCAGLKPTYVRYNITPLGTHHFLSFYFLTGISTLRVRVSTEIHTQRCHFSRAFTSLTG